MSTRHCIIPHRMALRRNSRSVAIQSILQHSPVLMQQLENSDIMKAMNPRTKNEGGSRTLNREVVRILDAYQPEWAHSTVDKRSFDIDKLSDHEFWVQLYDILWRCVVGANTETGG